MTEEVDNTLRLNSYVICGQFVRRPFATWFCGADDIRHSKGKKRSTTKMRGDETRLPLNGLNPTEVRRDGGVVSV